MSDLYWLTDEQMARLQPYFPGGHGKPARRRSAGAERHRVRQSQWVAVVRCAEGLRSSQDAVQPVKRWGEKGIFLQMMEGLAAASAEPGTVMIDATYLKAHRTASSLRVKKGVSAA